MAGNSGKIRGADEELAFQAHYRHGYARADGYSAGPYRRTPRKIVSEGHDSGRLNKRARIDFTIKAFVFHTSQYHQRQERLGLIQTAFPLSGHLLNRLSRRVLGQRRRGAVAKVSRITGIRNDFIVAPVFIPSLFHRPSHAGRRVEQLRSQG
jgi:hypothetical protein